MKKFDAVFTFAQPVTVQNGNNPPQQVQQVGATIEALNMVHAMAKAASFAGDLGILHKVPVVNIQIAEKRSPIIMPGTPNVG